MIIPPRFIVTPDILKMIAAIDAQRLFFNSQSIPKPLKDKIQRISILKSSLFSARIEGNPLEMSDFVRNKTDLDNKLEVHNIQKAVMFINSKNINRVTKEMITELHKFILKDISRDAGKIRHEVSAIFNQAGIAVYMPPPPSEINILLEKLLIYINNDESGFPILKAFISHLVFEKIHPFLDGNGRVGRLLIGLVLKSKNWYSDFIIPFEEYLDENKEEYYYHLDRGMDHPEDYLLFMLNAFLNQTQRIKLTLEKELTNHKNIFLPPRQEEIFSIIKDQTIVSFDIIRRRFLKVPPRTLRYDLKKLLEKDLIEKTGATRGVYYRVKK